MINGFWKWDDLKKKVFFSLIIISLLFIFMSFIFNPIFAKKGVDFYFKVYGVISYILMPLSYALLPLFERIIKALGSVGGWFIFVIHLANLVYYYILACLIDWIIKKK